MQDPNCKPPLRTYVYFPQFYLTPSEAECIVQDVRPFGPADIGSPQWLRQHHQLEALNFQAHADAQNRKREEFVKESFVNQRKVSVLVISLIVSEAWLEHGVPLMEDHLALFVDPLMTYTLLQHEGLIANLLGVLLYHQDAAQALSEDTALELVDWCVRKLHWLNGKGRKRAAQQSNRPDEILQNDSKRDFEMRREETMFVASMAALTILRHLSEHSAQLSLAVTHRMAGTHNAATLATLLLLQPPWERRQHAIIERWESGQWMRLTASMQRCLGTMDAQAWLLLHNIVLDPGSASKLDLCEPNVETMLKLRALITPPLREQLPCLEALSRFLEGLAMGASPQHQVSAGGIVAARGNIIIEQHSGLRDALLKRTDWSEIAKRVTEEYLSKTACAELTKERLGTFLQGVEYLCDVLTPSQEAGRQLWSSLPCVTVDVCYATGRGHWVLYGTHRYQLRTDVGPDNVSVEFNCLDSQPGAAIRAVVAGEDVANTRCIAGKRYRLRPTRQTGGKALPAEGKLVISFEGRTCEASIRLPAPDSR
jgi:hypothetical protein